MKLHKTSFYLVILLCAYSCQEMSVPAQPNIIFIFADDLGYGEVGAYGQEIIQTPNIDQLAKDGIKFTDFYSAAPVCAPARYMFMTGKHAGHAFIRGNDEWTERGDVWNYRAVINDPSLEGQRPIPDSTLTIAEVLQENGYQTALIGKWGLGAPGTEGIPNNQGFDFFYGYNCQRQAHNLYPPHLWKNEEKDVLRNDTVPPGTKLPDGADPNLSTSYSQFTQPDYAPEKMLNEALGFIESRDKSAPFMMYFASPLPHVPLQVPKPYVEKYRAIIGPEEPYLGQNGYFPHQYPKAAYAGMIDYLDHQVGELIAKLKSEGIYENTLIIFTSDNGPTYAGGVDAEYFNSAGIFPNQYGRTKGFTYEGGIRVPMIASWPGKIQAGTVSNQMSVLYDIFPTFLEVAGLENKYNSDGLSLLPIFKEGDKTMLDREHLYWEFPSYNGQQAVRLGKWKAVRTNLQDGEIKTQLYDLENDPQESIDLSNNQTEVVKHIEKIMLREHTTSAIEKFKIKALDKN